MLQVHRGEKVYMCGYCGKVYQKSNMASHLRTHSELRQIAVFENLPNDMKRKNHKSIPGYKSTTAEASIIELDIGDVTCEIDENEFPPPAAVPAEPEPPIFLAPDPSEVFMESEIPTKMEIEAEAEIQEGNDHMTHHMTHHMT